MMDGKLEIYYLQKRRETTYINELKRELLHNKINVRLWKENRELGSAILNTLV